MGVALRLVATRSYERICCDILKTQTHHSDTVIFAYGEPAQCMYFVAAGQLTYLLYSSAMLALASGGWFSTNKIMQMGWTDQGQPRNPTLENVLEPGLFKLRSQ